MNLEIVVEDLNLDLVIEETDLVLETVAESRDALFIRTIPVGDLAGMVPGQSLVYDGTRLVNASPSASLTLVMPSAFDVDTDLLTGEISVTYTVQSANRVWAGPASGSPAVPTYRALVAADIPNLASVYQVAGNYLTSSDLTPYASITYVNALVSAIDLTAYATKVYADAGDSAVVTYVVANFVNKTVTVNGHPLSSSVTVTKADVGLSAVENAAASGLYQPIGSYALASDLSAYQPLHANLTALAGLATNGFAKRVAGSWAIDASTYITGVAWGAITGTLSNQTDLQTTLNLKAALAGPAFTGQPTIAQGTIATALSPLTITETRNASGVTFPGIVYNVTNTASAAASVLFDLRVGGQSQFSVNADGLVNVFASAANAIKFNLRGTGVLSANTSNLDVYSGSVRLGSSTDTILVRDGAANTLAQRNSTNAQTFNLYETYTDASNYSRVSISAPSGGPITFASQAAGTGTARSFVFTNGLALNGTTGSSAAQMFWQSNASVNRYVASMNGTSGDLIFGRYNSSGVYQADTLNLINTGLVGFGGSSSSFPALKRSTTILQGRLADDSAFCTIQGIHKTDTNATTGLTAGALAALTNASITITDASGQVYRVPCII